MNEDKNTYQELRGHRQPWSTLRSFNQIQNIEGKGQGRQESLLHRSSTLEEHSSWVSSRMRIPRSLKVSTPGAHPRRSWSVPIQGITSGHKLTVGDEVSVWPRLVDLDKSSFLMLFEYGGVVSQKIPLQWTFLYACIGPVEAGFSSRLR